MTGNDYRLEDRPESQKRKEGRPNYALRRMKFAIAVIGLVVSVTLMLTWRDSGNMAGALLVEGVSRHRVVAGGAVRVQGRRLRVTDEEILPHWHFSPNAPVKDVDEEDDEW